MENTLHWYEFNQNNSGGGFVFNKNLGEEVFIQATDEITATNKAESLGIYFNGVEDGTDCECCGDRWSGPAKLSFPMKWNATKTINTFEEYVLTTNKYHTYRVFHYADGTITYEE